MEKKVDTYDRSLKILARLYPEIFLDLLDLGEDVQVMIDSPNINIPEKRIDYVWKLTTKNGEEGFVSVEFQLKGSSDAAKRCFLKCALLHEVSDLPVLGVMIFLTPKGYRETYKMCLSGRSNEYRFETIRLWEYKEKIESGELKCLAPFLILFTDNPTREILDKEKSLIMEIENEKERVDLLSIAITIAFQCIKADWVREYFKEEMKMIKTSDIVQEWIDEGIQQGVQQGVQQGMQEGMREAISLGLELKFGIKGLRLYERISRISSIDRLKAIKEAIKITQNIKEIEDLIESCSP